MTWLQKFVSLMARNHGRTAWATSWNELYVVSNTGWPERVNLWVRHPLPQEATDSVRRHVLEPVYLALWSAFRP